MRLVQLGHGRPILQKHGADTSSDFAEGRVPDMSIADDGYAGSAKRPDSDNDKS